jgi:hypothetical protein
VNYRLVVLTHGEGETLEAALDSFGEMVSPAPSELCVLRDGPGHSYIPRWAPRFSCRQIAAVAVGFCRATGACWDVAAAAGVDYVFHLEHDFTFLQRLDLRELAQVLDTNPRLAQMALMRGAVNDQEIAAGGLFESRAREYVPHGEPAWLEHTSYFTTNPSLMRRQFVADNPWPEHGERCEGLFGMELVARGYRFGVWGSGEPWCNHIGVRTGFGY